MAKLHIWDFNTLTLSGTQLTSTQPQSLTLDDIMNPTWQVLVEFVQLHTHSNISQHFDFLTTSRRWGGQAGGAWRGHSVRLQTGRDKWSVHTWGLFSLSLSNSTYLIKLKKKKIKIKILPHLCIGLHSPGFSRTRVWPSSQRGISGCLQFTGSHT